MNHTTHTPHTVNVDLKLNANKFNVDEDHPHIILKDHPDITEIKKLINACPAGLYKLKDDGSVSFEVAGCLECGTCRIVCGKTLLEKWEFPRGTFGVEYRNG
ncbi:MAG: 4Fe-4S dicluster domain-containing protein [Burkholderiales bacterium]|jgi:ferredoxin like protein|nr:4Fe-4S dicluster domain-containing protein [Burkholderiales bacterium]